jgi:hypothetical protein
MSNTGRIYMRPDKSSMTRMMRKLRKFKKNGFTRETSETAYKTWRGFWKALNGDPQKTDRLYKELYGGTT